MVLFIITFFPYHYPKYSNLFELQFSKDACVPEPCKLPPKLPSIVLAMIIFLTGAPIIVVFLC